MIVHEEYILVRSWLKDISASLGVELILDDEGLCSFQIGDDTVITIEVSDNFPIVQLYSTLLPLPTDNVELMVMKMSKALELNAFQAVTRGGAIATVPGGGLLIFCYNTPIEGFDSESFSKILSSFFETVVEIKKLLSDSSDLPKQEQKNFFKV